MEIANSISALDAGNKRVSVLGVGVSSVNLDTAVKTILNWIETGTKNYVTVTGVHGVIEAQDHPQFKDILNRSGLTVPDGMPLVWLSWLGGASHVTRVYGPDLTLALSAAMAQRGYSSFYYGGNTGVAEKLSEVLSARYPGLRTVGHFCPPFRDLTEDEENQLIQRVNSLKPNVIWVGLSTPKQERFMAKIIHRLDCNVMIGVGAAFDFHTGKVKQAPKWVQNAGMEWFFRLCMEPRRLWRRYLKNNPRFIYLMACSKLGLKKF